MTALLLTGERLGRSLWSLDRVWLAAALLLLGLLLWNPSQFTASVVFLWESLTWIAPFLLLSVIAAAWLKASGADQSLSRVVNKTGALAIVLAAAAGSLSPFCSCGVVPLVAGLLAAGVPLPVVFAFWVSSPLMDPETFVLMAAALGLEFTLAKTFAAFGLGLLGGFATAGLLRLGLFREALKLRAQGGCATVCGAAPHAPPNAGTPLRWAFWQEAPRRRQFSAESLSVLLFLGKWLTLAFILESLMVAWLPAELITGYLGGSGLSAIALVAFIGVPAYVNSYAAIPLIGQLVELGMAPGVALAFLIAGGITSLPAAMAVFALVRVRVFLWYLVFALLAALLSGFLFSLVA